MRRASPRPRPLPSSPAPSRRGELSARAARQGLYLLSACLLGLLAPAWLSTARGAETAEAARTLSPPSPDLAQTDVPLPEHYGLEDVWTGPPPTGLDGAAGVDWSEDAALVVAEQGGGRISVWRTSGEREAVASAGGDGAPMARPVDVALAEDQLPPRLYVADEGADALHVLSWPALQPVALWRGVGRPAGVALGPDGRVYVSDRENGRVVVLDDQGRALAAWGGAALGRDALGEPRGLEWGQDGRLYVADHRNHRIAWFDAQGSLDGLLPLDNRAYPGGAPYDVALDGAGDLHVAVERGVLRFRGRATYLGTTFPLKFSPPPDCPIPDPCRCKRFVENEHNHEGVRGVTYGTGRGLAISVSPQLGPEDALMVYPERGLETMVPLACRGSEPSHWAQPERIDAGDGTLMPRFSDQRRIAARLAEDGRVYSADGPFRIGRPTDLAARVDSTAALSGNQVEISAAPPFEGLVFDVLDPDMMTRRNRANDRIPDAGWWLTDLTDNGSGVVAVLDAGRGRVVLRQSSGAILGVEDLQTAREPRLGASDLSFDATDVIRILLRNGEIRRLDRFGRQQEPVQLSGMGGRAAEALAVAETLDSFVLTHDGWVFKHDAEGRPRAAFSVFAEAGPGRYTDLAVDARDRVLVTDAANDRVLVFGPVPPPQAPPASSTGCAVRVDKRAEPARIALGETVTVTLSVEADCGPAHDALDVVLVVDGSCQMSGSRLAAAREAGRRLVESLDLETDHMAIVRFTDEVDGARVVFPLSGNGDKLLEAATTWKNECLPPFLAPERGQEGRISDGLRAGYEVLSGPSARPEAGKVLILISPSRYDREILFGRRDGEGSPPILDREHTMWEARRLWALGARVLAVSLPEEAQRGFPLAAAVDGSTPGEHAARDDRAVGPRAGADATPAAPGGSTDAARASGPGAPGANGAPEQFPTFTPAPTPTLDPRGSHPSDDGLLASMLLPPVALPAVTDAEALPAWLEAIGDELAARVLLRELDVTDRVPSNMRLVAGSTFPVARTEPDGALRWLFRDVPLGSAVTEMRLVVEPLETGRHPTNLSATAGFTDGLGVAGERAFPVPVVEVVGPSPSPSATREPTPSPPPSATPTGGATPAPSPSPSATASPSATPRATRQAGPPVPVYLPINFLDICKPSVRPVDAVLLVDTSSSMNGAKLAAAKTAAREFVALLDLPRDHAAVVGFDRQARVAEGLSGDPRALLSAITGLRTSVGTRIDLGLWAALDEILGDRARPLSADPVIVLLTDGNTEGGTEGEMLQAAALARDAGVTIYGIGLGPDVSSWSLAQITGAQERVFLAPGADDLSRIYGEIAREIPCR